MKTGKLFGQKHHATKEDADEAEDTKGQHKENLLERHRTPHTPPTGSGETKVLRVKRDAVTGKRVKFSAASGPALR